MSSPLVRVSVVFDLSERDVVNLSHYATQHNLWEDGVDTKVCTSLAIRHIVQDRLIGFDVDIDNTLVDLDEIRGMMGDE